MVLKSPWFDVLQLVTGSVGCVPYSFGILIDPTNVNNLPQPPREPDALAPSSLHRPINYPHIYYLP